jgi:hypothetical protein
VSACLSRAVHENRPNRRILNCESIRVAELTTSCQTSAKVATGAGQLVKERFLLQEDADRHIEAAKVSAVLR